VPRAEKRQRKKERARVAREARVAAAKRRRRLRTVRNGLIFAALFAGTIALFNVLGGDDDKKADDTTTTTTTAAAKTATATITTNFGDIVIALDTKNAPVGAGRFIELAREGVYDGSRWHRIVKDFVIQGGAPGGDKTKDHGNPVVGEVPTDHYPVGSIAAAKTGPDPAGTFDSQFFIVTGAEQGANLPNDYARFGTVASGMDVVREIEALPVDADSEPTQAATIEKVTITES
jgi:cyclophilin family peptidyl-prolyl cis-trans isomerase